MSREERKRLLVLACTADRSAFLRMCVPGRRSRSSGLLHDLLTIALPLASCLPGRTGRWLRTITSLTRIGQTLGLLWS